MTRQKEIYIYFIWMFMILDDIPFNKYVLLSVENVVSNVNNVMDVGT